GAGEYSAVATGRCSGPETPSRPDWPRRTPERWVRPAECAARVAPPRDAPSEQSRGKACTAAGIPPPRRARAKGPAATAAATDRRATDARQCCREESAEQR